MGRDLRAITALLHICTFAERASSQCRDIGQLMEIAHALDLGRSGHVIAPMRGDLARMGRVAVSQVQAARRALLDDDRHAVLALREADLELNALNRKVFRDAVRVGEDQGIREWAMTMTMVARAFERIGDNAVDVCEQVAFIGSSL